MDQIERTGEIDTKTEHGTLGTRYSSPSKIDPSFKSKRYRDKLRTEIKALESLIPIDRTNLHRKIDSQTVFRLAISYLRTKIFFEDSFIGSCSKQPNGEMKVKVEEDFNETERNAAKYLEGKNIFQIIDGFLLITSADGTISYVSDNVLHYLGFNQIDLMHRCLYCIVHPNDHPELKKLLEGNPDDRREQVIQEHEQNLEQIDGYQTDCSESDDESGMAVCRMKCFNRTTAGYLKIHCSGKSRNIPGLNQSSKMASQVVVMFCQPFMVTGKELTNGVQQDVFWSKHDMDLTFRELDEKAVDVTGYSSAGINSLSLYQYIHPEDLATFAKCHKAMMESTEVQLMYFRWQTKSGNYLWMHTRGKVICKNSKKFSIVFTHCPIREEDSNFIRQESLARHCRGFSDLLHAAQFQYSTNERMKDVDQMTSQRIKNIAPSYPGFSEDVCLSLQSPVLTCPSSWHALGDRHSPVLPSSHVAHKITQREKQQHFQELNRRRLIDQQIAVATMVFSENTCMDGYTYSLENATGHVREATGISMFDNYAHGVSNIYSDRDTIDHPGFKSNNKSPVNTFNVYPKNMLSTFHPQCSLIVRPPPPYRYSQKTVSIFNMPPSPPLSPSGRLSHLQGPTRTDVMYNGSHNIHYSKPPLKKVRSKKISAHQPLVGCTAGNSNDSRPNPNISPINYFVQSSMRLKSPMCELGIQRYMDQVPIVDPDDTFCVRSENSQNCLTVAASCAVASQKCPQTCDVHYDIEASIHMKIVENLTGPRKSQEHIDLDLPSIGSFLEYLNDN